MDRGYGPVPTPTQVEIWMNATKAGDVERTRIATLVTAARNEAAPWPELLAEHHGNLQGHAGELESASASVWNFQPTVIAGLLQTVGYTRALLPLTDLTGQLDHDATIAGRIQRQQILYEPDRSFQFLIAEHVLTRSPGPDVMTGQRDRIIQLAQLPNVTVAVLPNSPMIATPWHGFNLYEQAGTTTVFLELVHRTEEVTGHEQVQLYRDLWDRLWASAATEADAIALIRGAGS
jgi:hypothetical protein